MPKRIGDIVLYKPSNGQPSAYGQYIHPAVVTGDFTLKQKEGVLDLTVLFHGCAPEPVFDVEHGTVATDGPCWMERE